MKDLGDLQTYFTSSAFLASVVIICITMALLVVIKKYLIKKVAYTTKAEQHQNTFIGVIFNLLQYAVILGCIVIVLQLHGVNVTSIIAGLGIIATLIGLALQDTMKDVISGINIYNNNFYKVGDMVTYNNELCEVKYFSARVTKFTSMYTGNTYTVCNSTINSIEKVKDTNMIFLTFDFEDDKKKVDKCFAKAIEETEKLKTVKKVDYFGLGDINSDGLLYIAKITAGHDVLHARGVFMTALYEECKKCHVAPNFNDVRKIKKTENW